MIAVATLIEPQSTLTLAPTWGRILSLLSKAGVANAGLPHFSWHLASDYRLKDAREILRKITEDETPFNAKMSGVGIFTGEFPVVHLPLAQGDRMTRLHRKLWDALGGVSQSPSGYYSPENWFPHITLVEGDETAFDLNNLISGLATEPLYFDIPVDHLAIIYRTDSGQGILDRFPFQGMPAR